MYETLGINVACFVVEYVHCDHNEHDNTRGQEHPQANENYETTMQGCPTTPNKKYLDWGRHQRVQSWLYPVRPLQVNHGDPITKIEDHHSPCVVKCYGSLK